MENTRSWITRSVIIATIGLLLAGFVFVSAQAQPTGPYDGKDPVKPETKDGDASQIYDPAAFQATWGITPDMSINCDPKGDLLSKLNPGSKQTANKLNTVNCKQQAVAAPVSGSLGFGSEAYLNITGFNGVGGESRMLKIFPATSQTRYVYLQCGKKVSVIQPACGCSGGNWHYINSCKGIKTVYVTIPCH